MKLETQVYDIEGKPFLTNKLLHMPSIIISFSSWHNYQEEYTK